MTELIKTVKIKYDKEISLLVFGDLHYGSDEQDKKLIKDGIKYAIKNNMYVAQIGDTLDSPIAGSKGFKEGAETLNDSLAKYKDDFEPLVALGKFLGGVQGNHDNRVTIQSKVSIDLVEMLHNEWSIRFNQPILYGKPAILLDFVGGEQKKQKSTAILLAHGSGGGISAGAASNSIMKHTNLCSNADIYVQGHFHQQSYTQRAKCEYNPRSQSFDRQIQHFVTLGSSTGYEQYAANFRLPQSTSSLGIINLKYLRQKNTEIIIDITHANHQWIKSQLY